MDSKERLANWEKAAAAEASSFKPMFSFAIEGAECGRLKIPKDLAIPIMAYTENWHRETGKSYSWGGYLEERNIYQGKQFKGEEEPRTMHLGIDVGGPSGTPVFMPLPGRIHSFNDNNLPFDYGPTIITEHQLNGIQFYLLFGHLCRSDLLGLTKGDYLEAGMCIGHFGTAEENGGWHPHLHLQVIFDLEGKAGDYPGVCRKSELAYYKQNCPNPQYLMR